MKYEIDLPSAGIGAGIAALAILALTSPLSSSLRIFDYSEFSPIWTFPSALAMGAVALVVAKKMNRISEDVLSETMQNRSAQFPAGVPGVVTQDSLSPVEWIERLLVEMPWLKTDNQTDLEKCVEAGLSRQVQHAPDRSITQALDLVFRAYQKDGLEASCLLTELTSRMREFLQSGKPFNIEDFAEFCANKGYVKTTPKELVFSRFPVVHLLRQYVLAKERALLASAEFVWLKQVDRTLWYALNNEGRRTFHVEGLGIMAHYERELATSQLLDKPDVLDGVAGVMAYFDEHDITDRTWSSV